MARPGVDDTITTELRAALRPSLEHVQAEAEANKASSDDLRRSARLLSHSARRLRQASSQRVVALTAEDPDKKGETGGG